MSINGNCKYIEEPFVISDECELEHITYVMKNILFLVKKM